MCPSGETTQPPSLTKSIAALETQYGIQVLYSNRQKVRKGIGYQTLQTDDMETAEKFLDHLVKAMDKYAPTLLKNTRLKKIRLATGLGWKKHPVSGLADFATETVLYDIYATHCDPTWTESLVHHELFHMIDYSHPDLFPDTQWKQLNASSFQYNAMASKGYAILDHPQNGFVSSYSMASAKEDKAQVFEGLAVREYAPKLKKWLEEDTILSRKVEFLKKHLKKILKYS